MSRLRDPKGAKMVYTFEGGAVGERDLISIYEGFLIEAAWAAKSDSPELQVYGLQQIRKYATVLAAAHLDDVSHLAAVKKPRKRKNPDRNWLFEVIKAYRAAKPGASCEEFCRAAISGRLANVRVVDRDGRLEFSGEERTVTVSKATMHAYWGKVSTLGN